MQDKCFFCDNREDNNPLHRVHTFRLDCRVRQCVDVLQDSVLHAKLMKGEAIAQEAVYHKLCLLDLYRRANNIQLEDDCTDRERQMHGITFSELIAFIEESRKPVSVPVFKLSELTNMYTHRLNYLN